MLADYLILCMEKEEKRKRKLLTDNRLATINKRETSFEGLAAQFENGEDSIYNFVAGQDTAGSALLTPKITITQQDLKEIPHLQQLRDCITSWEQRLKTMQGRDAYVMKKALIEMRKDQYIIKNSFKPQTSCAPSHPFPFGRNLPKERVWIDPTGTVNYDGVTLLNPKIVSIIFCNYSRLKEDSYCDFAGDLWYLMQDFDLLADKALREYPFLEKIAELKVDGLQNQQIADILEKEFNKTYSLEYISNLWRNKIPKLIASAAEDQWLNWYFLDKAKGKYKYCRRCGQVKLALPKYFSKNTSSKDGFYSICKECRKKKTPKK